MPTDLSCKPCKGTGKKDDGCPTSDGGSCGYQVRCPDCGGSGVAAWAVEAGIGAYTNGQLAVLAKRITGSPMEPKEEAEFVLSAVLAAVREEAKKHQPEYPDEDVVTVKRPARRKLVRGVLAGEEGAKRE